MINSKSINQTDEEIRPRVETVMKNKQCRSSPDSHGVVWGDEGRVGRDAVYVGVQLQTFREVSNAFIFENQEGHRCTP
jgi:hypothetical protein